MIIDVSLDFLDIHVFWPFFFWLCYWCLLLLFLRFLGFLCLRLGHGFLLLAFPEMYFHVGSETALLRETLRAEGARKGLFPSVHAKVFYHLRVCGKGLFAYAAFMKPFASVLSLVSSEIALVDSAEVTILTVMIRLVFLLGVFEHVSSQVAL